MFLILTFIIGCVADQTTPPPSFDPTPNVIQSPETTTFSTPKLEKPVQKDLSSFDPKPTSTTQHIGNQDIPIVILDNLLPTATLLSLSDALKSRETLDTGRVGDQNGRIESSIINSIFDSIYENEEIGHLYRREKIRERKKRHGNASVSCRRSDVDRNGYLNSAATTTRTIGIFYMDKASDLGADGGTQHPGKRPGLSFYREKVS